MRNYGKPVTDDIVRQWLPLDLALYSVWMPGDPTTAVITSTYLDPLCSYHEIIELDDVAAACAAYLVRMGAPTFCDAKAQDLYTDTLEDQIRLGLAPADAQKAALQAIGVQMPAEAATG